MTKLPADLDPELVERLTGTGGGALAQKMDIEFLELSAEYSVATMPGRYAVGIEINATHSRSVTEGLVTGTCRALVLGRTLCTHEIVMTDEQGRRLSTVRMTNFLRDR